MAAATILDGIEEEMVKEIGHMLVVDGYNFNWSATNVNEEDDAIGSFPRAVINPTSGYFDKETNMDSLSGTGSNDYTNEVLITILVKGQLPDFDSNPNFAIRTEMRKALDDLKKLFGTNYNINCTCDNIMYKASQGEYIKQNDVMSPAQLRTVWRVVYSQDRRTPTQYAGA